MSDPKTEEDAEDAKTEEDAKEAKEVAKEGKINIKRLTKQSNISATAKQNLPAFTKDRLQWLNSKKKGGTRKKRGGTRKKRGTHKNRRRRKSRRKMNR